jgi:K+-sensing histidine kinase KdpD
MTEIQNRSAAVSEFVLMLVRGGLVRSVLPVTLSLAVVLLTSVAVAAIRPHLSVRDPEDLALVYFFPTIFIAMFFGSTAAVISSFVSGLAAAYFVYPPYDSILIYDPRHAAELGFFLMLAITGTKAISVITER